MTNIIIGALSSLLFASLVGNAIMALWSRRSVRVALQHETIALDRAHAAELRSAQQIDALLDRISTEPRFEVRAVLPVPEIDTQTRKYIADHPADDAAWNDFRGEQEEAETA